MHLSTYSKNVKNTAIFFFLVYSVIVLWFNQSPDGRENAALAMYSMLLSMLFHYIMFGVFLFKQNVILYNLNLF